MRSVPASELKILDERLLDMIERLDRITGQRCELQDQPVTRGQVEPVEVRGVGHLTSQHGTRTGEANGCVLRGMPSLDRDLEAGSVSV